MKWFRRLVASHLTNRLAAATTEPQRNAIIKSCTARCTYFGEVELITLWKTMYFYWTNKTSYIAVEELFVALESSIETSVEALMSFCKMIIEMPHRSNHLLPAFSRFILASRLNLSPSKAMVLRDALVAVRDCKSRAPEREIFHFVDYVQLCSSRRHDSPDVINEVLGICFDLIRQGSKICGNGRNAGYIGT